MLRAYILSIPLSLNAWLSDNICLLLIALLIATNINWNLPYNIKLTIWRFLWNNCMLYIWYPTLPLSSCQRIELQHWRETTRFQRPSSPVPFCLIERRCLGALKVAENYRILYFLIGQTFFDDSNSIKIGIQGSPYSSASTCEVWAVNSHATLKSIQREV